MTRPIDQYMPHTGRYIQESGALVNLADIAQQLQRNFGGLNAIKTAEAYPVISLKANYGLSALRDIVEVTGSGTVTNAVGDGKFVVATGTTPSSTATLLSVEHGRYVSGTIAVPGMGVKLVQDLQGSEVARWGYFNDDDGFGFGADANGLFVFRRYNGVETVVRRSDWNDPVDGTGPSGITINANAVDIYQTPYRWYGAGPITYSIAGIGTGTQLINVHVFEAPAGEPIVKNPNHQLKAQITNDGSGRNINLEVYGRQYGILGRYNPNRRITGEHRIAQSVGTTFVPLIAFRIKPAFESMSVKPAGVSLIVSSSPIIYEIRVGSTLTGASFAAPSGVDASETALEFDISATAITDGQKIYTGLAEAGTGNNALVSGADIPEIDLPVNTEVVLCARSISGNATVTSAFRASEEW